MSQIKHLLFLFLLAHAAPIPAHLEQPTTQTVTQADQELAQADNNCRTNSVNAGYYYSCFSIIRDAYPNTATTTQTITETTVTATAVTTTATKIIVTEADKAMLNNCIMQHQSSIQKHEKLHEALIQAIENRRALGFADAKAENNFRHFTTVEKSATKFLAMLQKNHQKMLDFQKLYQPE